LDVLESFCANFGYEPVTFKAYQTHNDQRLPIYHTNVMMALAENFAIICSDTIDDKKERKIVLDHLKKDGREIIKISEKQMHHFAGNMLQVIGAEDKRYMVMSYAAYHSLDAGQINRIENHCEILHSSLETIETCGGGSARCMMAEVFLPK
jgi:hypothetical protein